MLQFSSETISTLLRKKDWQDVELALHVAFLMQEVAATSPIYEDDGEVLTPFGLILQEISNFHVDDQLPEPALLKYFEGIYLNM